MMTIDENVNKSKQWKYLFSFGLFVPEKKMNNDVSK